jgi:hypothetical protein
VRGGPERALWIIERCLVTNIHKLETGIEGRERATHVAGTLSIDDVVNVVQCNGD